MRVILQIEPECGDVSVTVTAPQADREVLALVERLRREGAAPFLPAFRDGEAVVLPCREILRFFSDGKGVSCQTAQGIFTVRRRLYELEEELEHSRFVRVSQSELINLDRVSALDLSLSGTIRLTLEEGAAVCYASRRYVKKIKQALGL